MEKVKEFTDFAKRHHFWFIAAIVTVAALFVGWMANSAMDQKYTTESGAFAQAKSSIDAVQTKTRNNHPNTTFQEKMAEINKERQENVKDAWTNMYQQQRESILKWPEDLTKEFRDEVRNNTLRDDPIEKIDLTADPKREIPSHLRIEYKNYIEEELPKLAAEIGAEWTPGGPMAGVNPNDPNAPLKKEPVVLWNSTDQALVLRHFTWPGEAPTTHQLLYAQEDLWVLTALIQIIKRTNGGAETRHKAAIREILAVEMGADVKGRAGQVQRLLPPADPMNPMAQPLAPMGPMPLAGPVDPLAAAKALNDPANNRYVNLNYEPLTGEALKAAVNSALAADAYAAVAKRMPLRLRVKMDTRKLNKLLAECGNSTLPVEIRQVRIGCAPGVGMAAPGPGGPAPGNFGNPRPPMHEGGPRPPPVFLPMGPRPNEGNANGNLDEFPHDKEVELYGIIYIFNPVNRAQIYSAEELAAIKAAEPATPMAPMAGAVATPPAGVAPMPPAPAPLPMPAPAPAKM